MAETVKVTTRLTRTAREGFGTVEERGVTLTAFLEAVGQMLHENRPNIQANLDEAVERARLIDLERRSRRW